MNYVYYYDTTDNKSLFSNKINAGQDLHSVAKNVAESNKLDLDDFLGRKISASWPIYRKRVTALCVC